MIQLGRTGVRLPSSLRSTEMMWWDLMPNMLKAIASQLGAAEAMMFTLIKRPSPRKVSGLPKSPPWFQDADVLRFTEMMTRHGVDTYVLLVGDQTNFCTRFGGASCSGRATDPGCRCADPADTTARDATVSDAIALVNRFQMTGVDLDYEHLPVKTNATAAGGGLQKSLFQQSSDVYNDKANLVKPFSLFLRQISAALHAKGHKLSQCVGLYPTRDGGASMFYDPAVVGETVDTVRVMNYDMCKPRPPTRQPSR